MAGVLLELHPFGVGKLARSDINLSEKLVVIHPRGAHASSLQQRFPCRLPCTTLFPAEKQQDLSRFLLDIVCTSSTSSASDWYCLKCIAAYPNGRAPRFQTKAILLMSASFLGHGYIAGARLFLALSLLCEEGSLLTPSTPRLFLVLGASLRHRDFFILLPAAAAATPSHPADPALSSAFLCPVLLAMARWIVGRSASV